jgi:hypothetical protein
MTDLMPIISRAVGAQVYVTNVRDFTDGTIKYAIAYESRGDRWLSKHRFHEPAQAEAGALTLADWLGCEVRG